MLKKFYGVLLVLFTLVSSACAQVKPEDALKKDFPDLPFTSVKETIVKGLYEVVSGDNILYYNPEKGIIIAGQMFNKEKKSITGERLKELRASKDKDMAAKAKDLPLDKAVKIGDGKNIVIEFTDPDCPYCRKMSAFIKTKTDITRYVFFFPLPSHPNAPAKAKWVLCSDNKAKALEEVMEGKLDDKQVKVCDDPKVAKLLEEQLAAGTKLGVTGTPAFLVNGVFVGGADTQAFEAALKK